MLKIYNTLTNKKEEFKPINKGKVGMYVCGPTVDNVPHLGHARMQVVFDIFRKYLKFIGYKVNFVSNVTDIDDKIINKANELGISIKELTSKNEKEHREDYIAIGADSPNKTPHATGYIKEMIELVKILEKKGYAYIVPNDGVYYDISKFKDYGKLSGIDLTNLKKGTRSAELSTGLKAGLGKKDSKDFVLWKFSKKGEPEWDSPWGKGRPGWHIECSAMTHAILGNPFDIHTGGQDLIFPHHEDEIAQSEAGYGKKMANYWMHNGMVNINKEKMSKSLGNFTTIKDLLKEYSGEVIRYFVIASHYRKPLDFSANALNESRTAYERLRRMAQLLEDDGKINKDAIAEFESVMNDDVNTAGALQVIWKLARDSDAKGKVGAIRKIDEVLGLKLLEKESVKIPTAVNKIVKERENARKDKDWARSDELRDEIKKLGFNVLDSSEGAKLEKI